MVSFDAAHAAVNYPPDRRFRIWVRPSILIGIGIAIAGPAIAAWIQRAVGGLPSIRAVPDGNAYPNNSVRPHGFPGWVRWSHFLNFSFVTMLMRSGISILMDHPRLYFNDHCTPGSEWIRFTPLKVPRDRIWTAKDDARYISPWIGTPGYRHTVGIARSWHFLNVYGFVITGVIYVSMLFASRRYRRIVPRSPLVLRQGWNIFVHYANFRLPPEPNAVYGYNALQQIAYFAVVLVFGPAMILTGLAMSPAVVNRFSGYTKLFGGRQAARSIHFIFMLGFFAFIAVHVTLISITGFVRNMNHIVLGHDDERIRGAVLGFLGIAVTALSWWVANYVSWHRPRLLQHAQKAVTYPLMLATFSRLSPRERYTERDISPYLWPNGKMQERSDWKRMVNDGFREYKLQVRGLVENPLDLSLAELEALGRIEVISMIHCIQGWTGVAKWSGVPMRAVVEMARPKSAAKVVAFFSFGDALYGGQYYDTQSLDRLLQSECMLAAQMNGAPLSEVHGAPLRLYIGNQLGYKMVKWIERIEFIESEKQLGQGEGGKNEDDEYFDLLPNI